MPRWLPGTRSDHASTAAVTSSTASLFAYQVEALTLHVTLPPTLRLSRTSPHYAFCVMQVLQISCRPTTRVTYAASSRLCLKSWQPNVNRVTTINKRKVRKSLGYMLQFQYSLCFSTGSKHKQQSIAHSTDCAFYFCGVQQVLFYAVQCWRTALSVRRPSPHQRWQPRPGRASLKVSKSTCNLVQVLLKY